jgi:hypothetical protein
LPNLCSVCLWPFFTCVTRSMTIIAHVMVSFYTERNALCIVCICFAASSCKFIVCAARQYFFRDMLLQLHNSYFRDCVTRQYLI